MAQPIHASPVTHTHDDDARSSTTSTRRGGWTTFAGVMFIAAAGINALWGISALVNDKYFSVDKLLFGDLAMWGAIYLAFAAVFVVIGLLILLGSTLGIMLGAVIAVVHGWTALLTIGAYPLWAVTVIVIDGLISYGLLVHGLDESLLLRRAHHE
jgi:hypothetical protein